MGMFNSRRDEGIFLGYSFTSRAYWVYNKRTKEVIETINVVIDEVSDSSSKKSNEEIPKSILSSKPKVVQE